MNIADLNINIVMNPVYIPYMDKPQFLQIFFGGSSSGKSYWICQKIVLDNFNGANYLVCRNVAKTIRKSVFNEIKKAISAMGLNKYYRINSTDMEITCKLNNKQILFVGLDDPEKVKSITPINGVIERAFIEEATEVTKAALLQIKKRLRGRSQISKHIYLAFNPILKSHYIYKDYFKYWQDDKTSYEDQDICILKTTYKDNLFLTAEDRKLLEDETDQYFYEVYTLGNWGVLGHVIFKNWRVTDLSAQKRHFDHIFNGLDFGYSSDPNALIRCHLDRKRKKIYVFAEDGQAGMNDFELAAMCRKNCGEQYIGCDCAEPKTIDFLKEENINAYGVQKGADSINRGIRWLQGYEIIIDVTCQNFKNEIEQYHWREDKNGEPTRTPVDKFNHWLDALRYALEDEINDVRATAGVRI